MNLQFKMLIFPPLLSAKSVDGVTLCMQIFLLDLWRREIGSRYANLSCHTLLTNQKITTPYCVFC